MAAVLLLSSAALRAAERPLPDSDRFDEVGIGRALSHETRDTAVARARDDALAKAMRKGADVFYGFSDYASGMGTERRDAVARYLFSSSRGTVVEESASDPVCSVESTVTICRLRLQGEISFNGQIDPSFHLSDAPDAPLGPDRRSYRDGEAVSLAFTATKDAYLYAFNWDDADRLSIFFPARPKNENFAKSGTVLRVPKDGEGVRYRAVLPKGFDRSTERVVILATQEKLTLPIGSMADVMRRLALLERRQWTLQVIPYEILRSVPASLPADTSRTP